MTDLTAPPTDRATCAWLPLPAGPPPSPPPDDLGAHRPPPAGGPAAGTATTPDTPPGDRVPDPAAVQAAIETLTQWLRSGGMLVCASDDDGPPDADCAHGTGRAEPAPTAPAAAQPVPGGRDGPEAAAADPAGHPAATCRHCRVSDDPVAMRAWARERGFRVADRGRLPAAVVAAYVAAHPHA